MTPEKQPMVPPVFAPIIPEDETLVPDGAPVWTGADPFFDEVKTAASATECTGLMPAMAETEAEGEALSEIESIHRIKGKNEKN